MTLFSPSSTAALLFSLFYRKKDPVPSLQHKVSSNRPRAPACRHPRNTVGITPPLASPRARNGGTQNERVVAGVDVIVEQRGGLRIRPGHDNGLHGVNVELLSLGLPAQLQEASLLHLKGDA